ncbi:lytic murein transglycosylase [Mesorhizobium loti R88b]|uniref:Lytic murein transglycosylase n=1 Tax=Mesorhizobium loti R88b TaxID=935548 RepID=A0A6M7WX08_RHILI|nr:lytic murein transglycosylase [Mesorhizobium loti R88b]
MRGTPLWPAGHLPRKEGDRLALPLSPITHLARLAPPSKLLISPLAGEMPGRAEGGASRSLTRLQP